MKRNMSAKIAVVFPVLIVFLSSSFALSADRTVARVGNTDITESSLNEAVERYVPAGGFHASMDPSQQEKYRKTALNDLIEYELLFLKARNNGVKVSNDDIESVIKENITRHGSKAAFEKKLKGNHLTMKEFRERVKKYNMVNILLRDLLKDSEYPEEEVKDYYEKNRSRYKRPEAIRLYHILLKVEPADPEERLQEKKVFAEELRDKILSGADFGDSAYQFSGDPYKYKNGDIGFVHRGRLTPKELEDAAFGLKQGEISPVIRTIHGFHIIKAGESRPEEFLEFDAVKNEIQRELTTARFEEKKKEMLEKLKAEYVVKVFPESGAGL